MRVYLYAMVLFTSCGIEFSQYPIFQDSVYDHTMEYIDIGTSSNLLTESEVIYLFEETPFEAWNDNTELLDKYSKLYPHSREVLLRSGHLYLRLDSLKKAGEILRRINHWDKDSEILKLLAMVCAKSGDHNLAIDHINRALYLEPEYSDLYNQKAEVYLAIGDTISAIKYYEKLLTIDPTNSKPILKLALLNQAAGYHLASIEMFERLGIEWLSNESIRAMGKAYLQTGQLKIGSSILAKELNQGDLLAGQILIDYFKKDMVLDSVFKFSNQILNIDSINVYALNCKAYYFYQKGYYSSSAQYYKNVLKIDPLNQEAKDGLSKVYGKIAYLRKVKEQQESLQLLEVPMLKIDEIAN